VPQYNYDYPNAIVGQIGTQFPADTISTLNPLRAQVTNLEYNGITTDGAYSLTIVGDDGSSATSDPFTASSNTAAQICAGIVAGCYSNPEFAGLIASAAVATTDNVVVSFANNGVTYVVTPTVPGSAPTQTNSTTAGYTEVAIGIILQASGGSFTTTYTDASLALGVTVRNAALVQGLDNGADSYDGPSMMTLMRRGEVWVNVMPGITVAIGEKVYFEPVGKTWSNVTTGSHVLVEGAQWRTAGTSIQRVFVQLPSET
jgi:hypothetical protein